MKITDLILDLNYFNIHMYIVWHLLKLQIILRHNINKFFLFKI